MKLINDFHPPEFARLTFHNYEGKEFWGPRINRAASAAYRNELVTVAEGLRSCATLHIQNWNNSDRFASLADMGLKWRVLRRIGPSEGFAHRAHAAPVDPVKHNLYTVVAKTVEMLDAFEEAHKASDHDAIGQLLGFPDCCRKWFNEVWPLYRDPIWQQAENTPSESAQWPVGPVEASRYIKGHPFCNSALRYIGIRSMFHLPCSYQCEASIDLGDQWFDIMRSHDPDGARFAGWILSLPHRWDVLHGHAKTVTPAFTVHAGSIEAAARYVVMVEPSQQLYPEGDIPGAIGGIWYPMSTPLKQIPLEVVK